jgi:hypothetical protein
MDVFNAGVGDDMIIINASNITALEQTGIGNRARVDAPQAPTIKSSKPSPLTSPALETERPL